MDTSRLLRYVLAGGAGALLGWVLLEPWSTEFGYARDFLLLYAVAFGIAFALIVQKFIYVGKYHLMIEPLKDWRLYAIPIIGVFAIKSLTAQSPEYEYNDERTEERLLLLDASSSMRGTALRELKDAIDEYVTLLDSAYSADLIGAIAFADEAQVLSAPSPRYSEMKHQVQRLQARGGTAMHLGLREAIRVFSGDSDFPRDIILVSDGEPDDARLVSELLPHLGDTPVYTIGVGGSYDRSFLRDVARRTGGSFFSAGQVSNLANVFQEVASAQGLAETTSENSQSLPLWKRLLGWSILGLVIGGATGLGHRRQEMLWIGLAGGLVGGAVSALLFHLMDVLQTGGGSSARAISFLLLGLLIGFAIYLANELYNRMSSDQGGLGDLKSVDFDSVRSAGKPGDSPQSVKSR